MKDLFINLADDLTTYLTLDQSINLSLVSTSSFYRGLNNMKYNRFIPVNNTNFLKLFNKRNSKTKEIIKVIKAGADINVDNNFGNSLHYAIHYKNIEIINLLIKLGINFTNYAGISPLHRAISTNNLEIVNILLNENVEVNTIEIGGQTHINHAIRKNNKEIIKALLLAGAKVNVSDRDGVTPLHNYTLSNNYDREILDMLIEAGANINAGDKLGKTPLDYARRAKREDIVFVLENL